MPSGMRVAPVEAQEICGGLGGRRWALFGSRLRAAPGPGSDINLQLEFKPGGVPGRFEPSAVEIERGQLFRHGVDVRRPQDLSRHFRDDALRMARPSTQPDLPGCRSRHLVEDRVG